jgi:hypothetical protein
MNFRSLKNLLCSQQRALPVVFFVFSKSIVKDWWQPLLSVGGGDLENVFLRCHFFFKDKNSITAFLRLRTKPVSQLKSFPTVARCSASRG